MPTSLISCKSASPEHILKEISSDYLQFCLTHVLDEQQFTFSLADHTQISLLQDGILGVNLDCNVNQNTKSIVLSCAVHGNETAPIEICNLLIHQILTAQLITPHRLLFIFGNIPAIHIKERFVEENLNRLFARSINSETLEGKRAKVLIHAIDTFFEGLTQHKYHYDLHTAIRPSKNEKFAVYPFLHGAEYNKQQLAFLSACDVNTILLSQTPTATFSYFTSHQHAADSFTVELGKVMPFGQNDMQKFVKVCQQLRLLLSEIHISLPKYEQCPTVIYRVNQVINKHKDDFSLHFDDNAANFSAFDKGTVLASETGNTYIAQYDGEAIVFPNANVEIGQRALLTVIPYQI